MHRMASSGCRSHAGELGFRARTGEPRPPRSGGRAPSAVSVVDAHSALRRCAVLAREIGRRRGKGRGKGKGKWWDPRLEGDLEDL
jgi:hypothetical protein